MQQTPSGDRLKEKLEKYLEITSDALGSVEIAQIARIDAQSVARDFLGMARSYYQDACYYRDKGDLLTALASVSYAHGFLDAGARAGLLSADNRRGIFAVDTDKD